MIVDLEWIGPMRVGNLADSLQKHKLERPHVYVYLQRYPVAEKSVAYVGRSKDFRNRMAEHFRFFLSLQYWLRNDHGKRIDPPDPHKFEQSLDCIEEMTGYAVADVKRLEFYAAACDEEYLRAVESNLIARLMERATADGDRLECDNGRMEYSNKILKIKHLTSSAECAAAISFVFGEK